MANCAQPCERHIIGMSIWVPMTSLLIQFKVQDYAKWRAGYDGNESNRASNGVGEGKVFQDSDDMNSITLLFDVTDAEKARAYVDSDDFKQVQARAGVIPPPTVTWLTEA